MADEVDTDDELKAASVPTTLGGPALEVDTDEDIRKQQAADVPARILWGSYCAAKIKAVQQGMYHVKFDDGASRWATCGELVLSDVDIPLHLLQEGMPILRPEKDESEIDFAPSFAPAGAPDTARSGKSTARSGGTTPRVKTARKLTRYLLLQGKLKRRAEGGGEGSAGGVKWEVQTDDTAGTLTTHPASELRLPVAYGLMLGGGGRLGVGTRVHALRGEWRSGTLHGGTAKASQMRGRSVSVELGEQTIRTWVGGGQVVVCGAPADPALLMPGARVVAHVPSRALRPYVEAAVADVDPAAGVAQCVTDDGKALDGVPLGSCSRGSKPPSASSPPPPASSAPPSPTSRPTECTP